MNVIEKTFSELNSRGRKVFIAYITAGDPSIQSTIRLVKELESNGVDIIEFGIPFSDPIADGPVNQEAAQRALKKNVHLRQIFDAVRTIRTESRIPIVFFTSGNSSNIPWYSIPFNFFPLKLSIISISGIKSVFSFKRIKILPFLSFAFT